MRRLFKRLTRRGRWYRALQRNTEQWRRLGLDCYDLNVPMSAIKEQQARAVRYRRRLNRLAVTWGIVQ